VYYDLVYNYLSGLTLINTTFILLCVFIVYVVVVTQRRKDFDFAEMLKSNGKPSSVRLAVLVSLATSTWVLMQVTLASKSGSSDALIEVYVIYLSVWSGSKVLEKGIDAWSAKRSPSTQNKTDDFQDTVPMEYR
jgi:hypothetical protein